MLCQRQHTLRQRLHAAETSNYTKHHQFCNKNRSQQIKLFKPTGSITCVRHTRRCRGNQPLSSECDTVKARLWPRRSGKSPQNFPVVLSPLCSGAAQGRRARRRLRPPICCITCVWYKRGVACHHAVPHGSAAAEHTPSTLLEELAREFIGFGKMRFKK